MIESANRLTQGPSGWCRAALCVMAIAGPAVTGCAAPAPPLPAVAPGVPVVPHAGRLADTRDAMRRGAGADSVAAASMRAAGLTPASGRRFSVGTAGQPLIAAFITGGTPGHRDSLVVAVGLGADGAAALLEAARLLAERSAFVSGPPRTILVSVPFDRAASSPVSDPTIAVARVLASPLWEPDAVVGVVVVGAGAASATSAASERDLVLTPVDAGSGDLTVMALAAYDALVAASRPARPPIVSTPDTTAQSRSPR